MYEYDLASKTGEELVEHRFTVEGSEFVPIGYVVSSSSCLIWCTGGPCCNGFMTDLPYASSKYVFHRIQGFHASCSCPSFTLDTSSALWNAACVPPYHEVSNDGKHVSHVFEDFQLVMDRDTTNLKDLTNDIADKVSYGLNQGIHLSFFNKETMSYSNIIVTQFRWRLLTCIGY
jgi:hypothetical protein